MRPLTDGHTTSTSIFHYLLRSLVTTWDQLLLENITWTYQTFESPCFMPIPSFSLQGSVVYPCRYSPIVPLTETIHLCHQQYKHGQDAHIWHSNNTIDILSNVWNSVCCYRSLKKYTTLINIVFFYKNRKSEHDNDKIFWFYVFNWSYL
jgi:hypothetical protein